MRGGRDSSVRQHNRMNIIIFCKSKVEQTMKFHLTVSNDINKAVTTQSGPRGE